MRFCWVDILDQGYPAVLRLADSSRGRTPRNLPRRISSAPAVCKRSAYAGFFRSEHSCSGVGFLHNILRRRAPMSVSEEVSKRASPCVPQNLLRAAQLPEFYGNTKQYLLSHALIRIKLSNPGGVCGRNPSGVVVAALAAARFREPSPRPTGGECYEAQTPIKCLQSKRSNLSLKSRGL